MTIRRGAANLTLGGTFLTPWAGRLAGLVSMDGKNSIVTWHGQVLNLPAATTRESDAGGLWRTSSECPFEHYRDQQSAGWRLGDGNLWFRRERRAMALENRDEGVGRVEQPFSRDDGERQENTGDSVTPVGVGWSPRFLFPGGDRTKVMLRVPATMRTEVRDPKTELPSGELLRVAGTPYDFHRPEWGHCLAGST